MIVCAEEPTKFCNWKERDTSILFGDGAGAVVVSAEDHCFRSIHLSTVSKTDVLYYQRKLEQTPYENNNESDGALVMHGKDVFKLAVSASTNDIKTVLDKAHVKGTSKNLI